MLDWMKLFRRRAKADTGDDLLEITKLTMEGRMAIAMGQPMEGLKLLREKHQRILSRFGKEAVFTATSAVDLGEALLGCGEIADAAKLLDWALARYRALEVADGRFDRALMQSAMATYLASDYGSAETLFLEVVSRTKAKGPEADRERAVALDYLAQVYGRQGKDERARGLLLEALGIFEKEDPGGLDTAVCLSMLASSNFHLHKYREAEVQNRRALAIFEAQGQDLHVAKTLDHLAAALCLRAQSENDRELAGEAIRHSERAMAIFQRLLPPNHRSLDVCRRTLSNAKAAYASIGYMFTSGGNGGDTSVVAEIPEGHPDRVRQLLDRSDAELQARRYDDALRTAREARALASRLFGTQAGWVEKAITFEIGVLRRKCTFLFGEPTGNLGPLESMMMQLRAHKRRGLAEDGSTAREGLDDLDAHAHREIVGALREALSVVDAGRAGGEDATPAPWQDPNFQSDYLEIVHYARQLSVLTGPQACARAAEIMQRDSETGAAAYLDQSMSRLQETAEQRQLRDAYRFAVAERDAHGRLLVAAALGGGTVGAHTQADLLEEKVIAARVRLVAAGCDPTAGQSNAMALDAVTNKLGDDEAVLLYHLGSRAIFIVALTAADVAFVRVEYERGLVEDLCRRVTQSATLSPEGAPEPFAVSFALQLHDLLIDPLMPRLRGVRRLMVSPHGDLWTLSFASLVTRPLDSLEDATDGGMGEDMFDAERRQSRLMRIASQVEALKDPYAAAEAVTLAGAWLGDRYEICMLPTLSPLVWRGRHGTATSGSGFFGIGDPDLPDGSGLENVPETQRLLRTLAASLGGDTERNILIRKAATVDRLIELSDEGVLARKRVLCFATHAVYPKKNGGDLLAEAGLVMSGGEVLRATDVAALSLEADLVLLTACFTGASSGAAITEPLSGLAQAFFAAGARALLISHWPVDALATEQLVERMFNGGNADETLSGALRRASIGLRGSSGSDPGIVHPAFWAGFSIVGDGAYAIGG